METAITVKFQNKHLHEAVKKLGSQKAVADFLKVRAQDIYEWLNFRKCPAKNGKLWARLKDDIYALTGSFIEEVFPDEIQGRKCYFKQQNAFTKYVECEPDKLVGFIPQKLLSPVEKQYQQEQKEIINKVIQVLNPKEQKVINLRFGLNGNTEHTYEEIGSMYNLSKERIRQIEVKALRELRHPTRSNQLKPFVNTSVENQY